jgi:hypothetical protein
MKYEKKQTAVEWLFEELNRIRLEDESGNIGALSFFLQQDEALKQAKAMEKQQIMDAHYAPKYGCFNKDYYQQTYGGKNGE